MADQIQLAELSIKFVGSTDDLQKGAQQAQAVVTASFDKIEKSSGQVEQATKQVDKGFKELDTSAVNLAARINIMERAYDQFRSVVRGAMDVAKLAAQAERVEDRFQKFAATIGTSEELLEAFNRGSAGVIDSMTAMNSSALLIQQGLVTTNAEMEKTVEMATRLGDQTLSATSRLEFFSQLLKNQSIRLLDNFGISSGRVRTRIKELQDATAGLSREEAFRIATFEEGQKALDILGERVDDNALKFERSTAKLAEMRIEMGQMVLPVMAKAIELTTMLSNETLILITALTGALGIATKFSGGLSPLLAKLKLTGTQFGLLAIGIGLAIAAYEAIRDLQREIAAGQEAAAKATASWSEEVNEAVESGADLTESVEMLADRINVADEALHKNGNILDDMATALVRSTSETKIMTGAAEEARKVIIDQASSFEEANRLIEIYNSRVTNAYAKLREFTIVQFQSNEQLERWIRGVDRSGVVIDDVVSISMEDWKKELEETRIATEKAIVVEAERLDLIGALGRDLDMAALRQKRSNELVAREIERKNTLAELEAERAETRAKYAEAAVKANEEAVKQAEAEAEAIRKVVELHEQALNTQIRRAERLKGATAEQIAGVAISELEKAQRAGLITFDEYATAVVEVQDRFGLADDASRAMTLGLAALVDEFINGTVQATEFDNILEAMVLDAQDGVIAFSELVDQVRNLDEASGRFKGVVDMSGTGAGVVTTAAERVMGPMQSNRGQDPNATPQQTGSGVVIYGDINLEGVEDADEFLRQLMSLME